MYLSKLWAVSTVTHLSYRHFWWMVHSLGATQGMAGDPGAWNRSKPWTDSSPFTNATAGLPTEEQLHDTQL